MQQGLETTIPPGDPSHQELAPGEQFGRYQIIRLLGKGGMGAVYEAMELETGRRVALKVLSQKLESPEHRQRFLREGRLAASVNHPNTLYVYGAEEIDGTPVMAMELAPGGTLEERVQRDGPLPVSEAVDLVLDVISGLEAAQAAGVLHRDVKPSNCFLDADGTVKSGDFGLSISTTARDQTRVTQSDVFLGTPAFSSPEQLRGDQLDVRSDIYSVGVMLYYLLTGKLPFAGKQMVQLLATVLERPPPSPRQARPEIPRGLADVVLRCLAKQAAHRFASYEELRQALWPYRSAAPNPGTVGFRILASRIDYIVLLLISAALPLLWVRDLATWQSHVDALSAAGTPGATVEVTLLSGCGELLYFAVLEGIWGASAGRAHRTRWPAQAGRAPAARVRTAGRGAAGVAPSAMDGR